MISYDAKLIAIYDKLEKQIKTLQLKHGIDGNDGADGISIKGDQGDRGHDGVGHDGKQGAAGADGAAGDHGVDGVSITSAKIDFDNHLVISLSDGTEIDAGALQGGSGGDQYFRSGSTVKINNDNLKDFKNPTYTFFGAGHPDGEGNMDRIDFFDTAGVATASKSFRYSGAPKKLTRITTRIVSGVDSKRQITYSANGAVASIADEIIPS